MSVQFAFGPEFQRALLRYALDDDSFAALISKHLQPSYFESPALGWIFSTIQWYVGQYSRAPSPLVLLDACSRMHPSLIEQYRPTVTAVTTAPTVEAQYIGERLTEFIKRNLFVDGIEKLRHLYNGGSVEDAYRFWAERADQIHSVTTESPDRSFFFEDFDDRISRRRHEAAHEHLYTFPTGIPDLDDVLGGGLSKGELGIWVAYPKVGKSHMLQWLAYYAVRALRIPVHYTVLEGGREQVEDRFDAAFAYMTARELKTNDVDLQRMQALRDEYQELRQLLVIRGFTKSGDAWSATPDDIYRDLVDLRQRRGFRPRLLVTDYGDLLKPRPGVSHDNEMRAQASVFRDLKALCDRDDGYAHWTASQAQRPTKGATENEKHVVRSQQIADCYEKVRCADFIGSLNRTGTEMVEERMRIFAELYRSNPAGRLIEVKTDFAHHRAVTSTLRSTQLLEDHSAQQQIDIDF